ncbi:MAG TPA: hypothetical protein VH186_22185 [Chloroflexia bacterium]|nr:hypothetical protein [Chloroflexia bacterium]
MLQNLSIPVVIRLAEAGINYTCIPNDFLDQVAPELSPSELRVMLYIYRHTFGYQKLADVISYEQFMHGIRAEDGRRVDCGAGVSRRALVPALASLEKRGLISRRNNGFAPATVTIAINKPGHSLQNKVAGEINNIYPAEDSDIEVQVVPQTAPSAMQLLPDERACEEQIVPEEYGVERQIVPERQVLPEEPSNQGQVLPERQHTEGQNLHLTKESRIQNKEDRITACQILEAIPGINPRQAYHLVEIAYCNGRDANYIQRLAAYVTTARGIKSPAAVLTTLIKANQERYLEKPASPKAQKATAFPAAPEKPPQAGTLDWSKFEPGGKYAFLVDKANPSA